MTSTCRTTTSDVPRSPSTPPSMQQQQRGQRSHQFTQCLWLAPTGATKYKKDAFMKDVGSSKQRTSLLHAGTQFKHTMYRYTGKENAMARMFYKNPGTVEYKKMQILWKTLLTEAQLNSIDSTYPGTQTLYQQRDTFSPAMPNYRRAHLNSYIFIRSFQKVGTREAKRFKEMVL